ncbi:hypothetical protein SERLA73DRAFT_76014 [Serpula lacrymans var. lacrymans S7.3]|uniref:Uncharacterized protein n=2 Tax=Serpula lacrymans var. lacrymans TaxID=341189 RepID=F8Q5Y0_SERL3|nr:uncharacterized protein SERLADRAFT_440788 [Serpula lacrymans var. lacrymans S7.9]EGN96018.1 hypothetical protein SERLA73DRAFT_76014 [Serpula lacrymans var. lacrymans S7.3]EGO21540.1 hypothetical protein SERLADRAFT_440788 [Serpula lacrymans var. lacrymans S7.9]
MPQIYCPQDLGAIAALMALNFTHSKSASYVTYNTLVEALEGMARAAVKYLKEAAKHGSEQHFSVVGDNVQAYAKRWDP